MVMELYDARKEAREYLDYYVNPDENKELEKFKKIRLEIPFVNLFRHNTTARLTRQMRWAKHNTTPYIQTSNIDKCVRNPVEMRHGASLQSPNRALTHRGRARFYVEKYVYLCSVNFSVFV